MRSPSYPQKAEITEVYFFGTCLVDLFYPKAGLAGMKLLEREGIKVIFPQDQTCCGQPAYNSGYREETKPVAIQQIKTFEKEIPIVVPSGSCGSMLRNRYPELLAGTKYAEAAERFSARVFELTEFLVHVLEVKLHDLGEGQKVTYHASCAMQREMGIRDEPKSLIRQLGNVELVELERERECCGFGGTFSIKKPEISAAMVSDKADDIESTNAPKLVSSECGCMMNITGHLGKRESQIKGQHIAEFLWERTNERD